MTDPVATVRVRTTRVDLAAPGPWRLSERGHVALAAAALAVGFVLLGVDGLDVGPSEARLGLAAVGSPGPLGQVFGYWAPDLWPGEVLPSLAFATLSPGGRPTTAAVRWPSAIAAILGGWILIRGLHRALGARAGVCAGLCWFASLAIIDRSGGAGVDLIVGVATLAVVDRLLGRGADWAAGFFASLAFLAGGWPPLLLIALVILVIGRPGSYFSARLVLPPMTTALVWSIAAIRAATTEAWAAAMTLPMTRGLDIGLPAWVLLLGLPWSPFALVVLGRSTREDWPAEGRSWVKGWLQAAMACTIAGAFVPGLGPSARVVALAGLLIAAAAGLASAWARSLAAGPRRIFFVAFAAILSAWLIAMTCGAFLWIVTMPYYRPVGIVMACAATVVAALGWSALGWGDTRRGLVVLAVMAAGLKLAHWGYYAPEWNYRLGQGPWGRAIGQWIPRKWPVYTFHDWQPVDLMFYIGRPVRQLPDPRSLKYLPGPDSRYVLLQASEFAHWPDGAPPLTLVARFQDPFGEERILARTPGDLPTTGRGTPRPAVRRAIKAPPPTAPN